MAPLVIEEDGTYYISRRAITLAREKALAADAIASASLPRGGVTGAISQALSDGYKDGVMFFIAALAQVIEEDTASA